MAIQSQQQLDAFKNVALQQGYDPKEVEAFMGLATAANSSKQAAADAAAKSEMDMYEKKLQMQRQYEDPNAGAPYDPAKDATLQRQIAFEEYKRKNTAPGSTSGDLTEAQKAAITQGIATTKYDENGGIIVVPADKKNANSKVLGYAEQLMNGTSKSIKDIPAEDRGEVVEYLKANEIDVYKLQKEREGKSAKNFINGLFNDYYGGSGRGSGDDLSGKGVPGLGLSGLFIKGRALIGQGKAGNYKSTKDSLLASLKAITGDSGIMTDEDAQRIEKLMPNVGANPDYAARQWDKINDILVSRYGTGIYESPENSPNYKENIKKVGLSDVGKTSGTKVGRFNIEVE